MKVRKYPYKLSKPFSDIFYLLYEKIQSMFITFKLEFGNQEVFRKYILGAFTAQREAS